MSLTNISCREHSNNMNSRIYERNIPSSFLEPSFSTRPSYSKHEILPIVKSSNNPTPSSPIKNSSYPIYNIQSTFNPGSRAPWSGYATNVDTESMLRNQIYFYQKNNDEHAWVPNSNSDLYNLNWK